MAIEIEHAVTDRGPRGTKAARLVFCAIARAADEYGFAYPGEDALARNALCDERTVRRVIQQLEREGWLHVRRKTIAGRASVYFVNLAKLAIGTYPGGSSRPPGKQRPKQPLQLQLERAAAVRFASGAKPPTGERDVHTGSASGVSDSPVGGQDVSVGSASGVSDSPIGRQRCERGCGNRPDEKIPPDISYMSHRTFSTFPPDISCTPLILKSKNSEKKSKYTPLTPTVETVQNERRKHEQEQKLPDERKSRNEGPATASAAATRRGNVVRMGLEHRQERRESRRWNELAREGTVTGVPAAAARVMRACGFTDHALLRQIVTAMNAHLAADRVSEVGWIEAQMVKNWRVALRDDAWALRFPMTPKYFFSDGRWVNHDMWPYDLKKLEAGRRARVGNSLSANCSTGNIRSTWIIS